MPYNFAVDSNVFTQRNFVPDILREKCSFIGKTATLRFDPLFAGLEAACDVHLRLTGKCIADFVLVITRKRGKLPMHCNLTQPDAAQCLSALISSPVPCLNSLSLSVAVLERFYCLYVTLRCDL